MAETTKIEWCDSTFNPWWGCTKISPACDNCYAAATDKRFGGNNWEGSNRKRTSASNWNQLRRWQKNSAKFFDEHGRKQTVFCASMADIFDNQVEPQWRSDFWELARECPDLIFLILTKRPQNIKKMKPDFWDEIKGHIMPGTTCEDQQRADMNIPHLLQHGDCLGLFVSAEPLLGPIDFRRIMAKMPGGGRSMWDVISPRLDRRAAGLEDDPLAASMLSEGLASGQSWGPLHPRIDWIIVGGESGHGARPMHPQWVRDIRDQCDQADVAFFFKQWGEWAPCIIQGEDENGDVGAAYPIEGCSDAAAHKHNQKCLFWQNDTLVDWPHIQDFPAIGVRRVGKASAGRLLDGKTHNEMPGVA